MRIALLTAIAAILTFSGINAAQAPPPDALPSVPDGDGAWTIRISTSGGFTGRGRGSVTMTSQGNLSCLKTSRPCTEKLVDDKLRPVARLVSSFDPSKWASPTPQENMVCNDCITTTVTFARREGGKLKIKSLSWNDATQIKAPSDVVRIVEMALSGNW